MQPASLETIGEDEEPVVRSRLLRPAAFPIGAFSQEIVLGEPLFERVLEGHREKQVRRGVSGEGWIVPQLQKKCLVSVFERIVERYALRSRAQKIEAHPILLSSSAGTCCCARPHV